MYLNFAPQMDQLWFKGNSYLNYAPQPNVIMCVWVMLHVWWPDQFNSELWKLILPWWPWCNTTHELIIFRSTSFQKSYDMLSSSPHHHILIARLWNIWIRSRSTMFGITISQILYFLYYTPMAKYIYYIWLLMLNSTDYKCWYDRKSLMRYQSKWHRSNQGVLCLMKLLYNQWKSLV